MLDGVVVGNLLISLLKHADRVTSASTKQPSCLQFIMRHLWVPVLGHIGDTLSSQAIAIRTRRRPDSSPLTLSVDRLAHGGAGPPRLALSRRQRWPGRRPWLIGIKRCGCNPCPRRAPVLPTPALDVHVQKSRVQQGTALIISHHPPPNPLVMRRSCASRRQIRDTHEPSQPLCDGVGLFKIVSICGRPG